MTKRPTTTRPAASEYAACVNFRRNLSAFIKAHKGVSQRSIAAAIGGAQSYVCLMLNGEYDPSLEYVQRIADAIQVPAEDLISNEKRFRPYLDE